MLRRGCLKSTKMKASSECLEDGDRSDYGMRKKIVTVCRLSIQHPVL